MSEVLLVTMIALGLSIDAGTVAMAVAIYLGEMTRRRVFRLVFHFGLFQFLMPLLGALLGALASEAIGKWSPVAAGTVLALLGVRMLWGAFSGAEEAYRSDPTRGLSLVTLSVATSLDALAAGAAMGLGGLKIMGMLEASLIIGIVCAAVTFAGILLGSKLGSVFERRARALGGLLLLAVGLKVGAGL